VTESLITIYIGERELTFFVGCRVPSPTVPLYQVFNLGSFFWALSLLIHFRSISSFSRWCCRWPKSVFFNKNVRNPVWICRDPISL